MTDQSASMPAKRTSALRGVWPLVLLLLGWIISFVLLRASPHVSQAILQALPLQQPEAVYELVGLISVFLPLLLLGWLGARSLGGGGLSAGKSPAFNLFAGLVIGAAGLAASFAVSAAMGGFATGALGQTVTAQSLALGTLGILLATSAEEVFFRGWIQSGISRIWGRWPALLLAALLFSAVHVIPTLDADMVPRINPMSLVNIFLAGLLFGQLFQFTGGLAAPIAAHFSWNWTESIALGLTPNPGVSSFGSFVDYDLTGGAMFGGSSEGLNPSYAVAAILAVLLILLLIAGRLRKTSALPVEAKPQGLATQNGVGAAAAVVKLADDSCTNVGKIREINEDSYFSDSSIGVWTVADGMGGHEAGERASQAIVAALDSIGAPASLDAQVEAVRNSILAANTMIYAEGQSKGQRMGSTVVSLVVHDDQYAVLWAGDSRAYLYRDGALMQVSRDHTQVQSLIDRGLLAPEDAAGHPMSHVLARAIGVMPDVQIDVVRDVIKPNDIFLLCSDGLYGLVSDAEIAERLDPSRIGGTAEELVNLSLERGAPDNVTVIAVLASA